MSRTGLSLNHSVHRSTFTACGAALKPRGDASSGAERGSPLPNEAGSLQAYSATSATASYCMMDPVQKTGLASNP